MEIYWNENYCKAFETLDPTTFTAHSSEKNYDTTVSLIGPHGVADPDQFIMSHKADYLWTKGVKTAFEIMSK